LFCAEYLDAGGELALLEHQVSPETTGTDGAATRLTAVLRVGARRVVMHGEGNGPLAAFVQALGLPLNIHSYEERAVGVGAGAQACAFIEMSLTGCAGSRFGVGLHDNILTAALLAVCSALNRLLFLADPAARAHGLAALADRAEASGHAPSLTLIR
jgi:2-isopropylmalate synthase